MATTLRRIAPVFITTDLAQALSYYERLGFAVEASDGGDHYGFVRRDGMEVHVATVEGVIDLATNNCCAYVWVDDASALYKEWTDAKVDGRLDAPVRTDYGLTEGAHVDPDGNLIEPSRPFALTVLHVPVCGSAEAARQAAYAWGQEVWNSYEHGHETVRRWLKDAGFDLRRKAS